MLVVSGNLKAKSAPTVTCKHHLLRMPLNEHNHYSESIGVFPAESKSTTPKRAKDDFVWSKLVPPFIFAVLATIQKQYSPTSTAACGSLWKTTGAVNKPFLIKYQSGREKCTVWLQCFWLTAPNGIYTTFTLTFSTSARKDARHPSPLIRLSQECQSEKEDAFMRHLEVAVASERKRCTDSPFLKCRRLSSRVERAFVFGLVS